MAAPATAPAERTSFRRYANNITYITEPWGARIEIVQRAPEQATR